MNCIKMIAAYVSKYDKEIKTKFEGYRKESIVFVQEKISMWKKCDDEHKKKLIEDQDYIYLLKYAIAVFKNYSEEPIFSYPNFHVWMLSDNEPIGMSTIDIGGIIWSNEFEERGPLCFKSVYFDIKVNKIMKTNDSISCI